MQYEVSFFRNNVYQANLVETEKTEADIVIWFEVNRPNTRILSIQIATIDSQKPGKPIIRI